jgi:23S rRNA-intervening sequence protein
MRNYRDLQTWNKAHKLTLELYKISRHFPKEELYGVTSQLRRAASSDWRKPCGRVWPPDKLGVRSIRENLDGFGKRARLSFTSVA